MTTMTDSITITREDALELAATLDALSGHVDGDQVDRLLQGLLDRLGIKVDDDNPSEEWAAIRARSAELRVEYA